MYIHIHICIFLIWNYFLKIGIYVLKYKSPHKPCCFKSASNSTQSNSFTRIWLQPNCDLANFPKKWWLSCWETILDLHSALQIPSNTPVPRQPPLLNTLQYGIIGSLVPIRPATQAVKAAASLTRRSIRWFRLEGRSLLCLEMMAQNIVLMAQVFSRIIKQNRWDLSSF